MSDEALLRGVARFAAYFLERDVRFEPELRAAHDGGWIVAADRSGGTYVLHPPEGPGVWLHGSEGERVRLAADLRGFVEGLAQGCTVADLAVAGSAPSERPAPGVLRWLASSDDPASSAALGGSARRSPA